MAPAAGEGRILRLRPGGAAAGFRRCGPGKETAGFSELRPGKSRTKETETETEMEITRYTFQPHGDARGQLIALEENRDVPFPIRRVYYMYSTAQDAVRGKHAHRELQQILICLHGSCKILMDNGEERETVTLDKPWDGLGISSAIWREMYDFSPDAVLMVLASAPYDESDYIRDYEAFLAYARERRETGKQNTAGKADGAFADCARERRGGGGK